jgi:PAS domain S-box-containing protein
MRKLPGNTEAFLCNIIDAVPICIYWKDLNGTYLGCNQHALTVIGASSFGEVVGRKDDALPWKENASLLLKNELQVIKTQKRFSSEESLTLHRKKRIFSSAILPFFDEHATIIGTIGVLVDITDRQKSEQLLRMAKQFIEESYEDSPAVKPAIEKHIAKNEGAQKEHRASIVINASKNPAKKPVRILLVEDNDIASKTTAKLIESLGYSVDVALTSDEAIALFAPGKYGLVYMDLGLPERTGQETARLFRDQERKANTAPTPILALTVQATAREKAVCLEHCMDGMLIKPLSIAQAQQTIEHFALHNKQVTVENLINLENVRYKPNTTRALIDLEEGAHLVNGDEALAKNMLRDLVATLPKDRAHMEKAFKKHDMPALLSLVHKLHGGLCYVGAPALRTAAKNLELALNGKEVSQRTWCYQKLLDEMVALEKAFKTLDAA